MVNPRPSLDVQAFLKPTVFGQIGQDVLDMVARCAVIERFEIPTLLNAAGMPLERLRLVVDGNIAIIARKASGKEVVISEVGVRGWAAWLPCFMPAPPNYDFYSGAKSCFIALPVNEVQRFCIEYPVLYPLIIGEIGLRFRLLMDWTSQSVLFGPEQRMAKLILILAQEQKIVTSPGSIPITQNRLAGLARCSRQSASVLFSNLEKKGLIQMQYGRCDIPCLAALAAFADADEADAEQREM
jgi:CRP-like cAMP-binding protein